MPTNLFLSDLRIIFFWPEQTVKLLITEFSRIHSYFLPLRTKYLSQHLTLEHPQPMFFPSCEGPSFTPMDDNRKIKIPYVTTFVLLDSRKECKVFRTSWWQTFPELIPVLISSSMRFWFISATFWRMLATFILWFLHAFYWPDTNTH